MTEEHDPGSEFALQIVEIRRFDEVGARFHKIATLWEVERKYRFKRSWLGKTKSFKVRGYCPVCGYTDLTVHDTWAQANPDGSKTPCWREQAWCGCGMNTRMRSALDWIIHCERPAAEALIYCTEATTPFFRGLVRLHPLTLGSAVHPLACTLSSVDSAGLRCESLERLSFPDKVFELLASLDVLEHAFPTMTPSRKCTACSNLAALQSSQCPSCLSSLRRSSAPSSMEGRSCISCRQSITVTPLPARALSWSTITAGIWWRP
ncbi:MAG: hypothetical protein AB9866_18625 [Syntrophobacteraceae bacterium]